MSHALDVLVREFPDASLNALMFSPPHDDEYFAMDYRLAADAVHVISSGLDQEGWTPVPEDTAVKIDLETRAMQRLYP